MTQARRRPTIAAVFGTRPEAIKMAPVITALRATNRLDVRVIVTAQHRDMLDQVLDFFEIEPDIDLDLMQPGQGLDVLGARALTAIGEALDATRPDRVLVHGDTLTTMMGGLAAYLRRIRVGHVEAGLRTGDIYAPWPEEVSRRTVGALADMHFAPTQAAAKALFAENLVGTTHVTGNTVVDALQIARARLADDPKLAPTITCLQERLRDKRIVAVTAHRRESFGAGLGRIAAALARLAQREDVAIVYPLHRNPEVANIMRPALEGLANVVLTEPLDYPESIAMLAASTIVLTDSGGIQEEAVTLGKPVLILRETTERQEGIETGTARLVGTDTARIVMAALELLDDRAAYDAMARPRSPYGDGQAAQRIAKLIVQCHCE